jgi:hypothetical protein
MKKRFIIYLLLSLNLIEFAYSQNNNKNVNLQRSVSIDTIPCIQVNKVIFYRDPLVFQYYNLVDTSYIPEWYSAYCATHNPEFFKYNASIASTFFSKEDPVNVTKLEESYEKAKSVGGVKNYFSHRPWEAYMYVFAEIWIADKESGKKYVIVQGGDSDKPLDNLRFNVPTAFN